MSQKTDNIKDLMAHSDVILPALSLRDVVVFPNMVIPLFLTREKSLKAVKIAIKQKKQVFLIAQKESSQDDPVQSDLYTTGVIGNVLQLLTLPDGTTKVLIEGIARAKLNTLMKGRGYLKAQVLPVLAPQVGAVDFEAALRTALMCFDDYVKLNKKIPVEVLSTLSNIDDADQLLDIIASHLLLKQKEKQSILSAHDLLIRVELLIELMMTEIDIMRLEKKVQGRVKTQMETSQREYYLNEKIKAIQKELGDATDEEHSELDGYAKKIKASGMSQEAIDKATSELKKLKSMPAMSSEASISRNYLDTLLDVPWKKESTINHDLHEAQRILDEDHYGLEKVKERIVEYLAVQQRAVRPKSPILCLVGPPGVGKTSLGESIARATQREFSRIALGGVRDEAEIRGHRRTYIGAMPGKIIQKMTKAKVKNPLMMLDEIDKISSDFRGDPASALLEVLDPEQNNTFNDHYLEVDYDLSKVMFIATSNSMNIPAALRDRMEVIRLSGYTENEKLAIAKRYLLPKQLEANGLSKKELKVSDAVLLDVVRYYTCEAGVRNLERELAKIARKVVTNLVMTQHEAGLKPTRSITKTNLEDYLGVRKYHFGLADKENCVGQVTGLAWTEVGGDLLHLEVATMPGKGKTLYTGQLGDVMQESIQAALTVVRTRAKQLGVNADFHRSLDLHVHVPEGATPKDGPSAGIGMCTALVSALTNIAVRKDVAMTGEITLRGEVLPIGGLKEKLLAALRGGIKTVIIPQDNEKDLKEVPAHITQGLNIIPVKWIDQVLTLSLTKEPTSLVANEGKETQSNEAAIHTKTQKREVIKATPLV